MNVFEFKNYLDPLKAGFKGKTARGQAAKFTKEYKVNPSYFSRVLNAEVPLTPDQAAAVCEFWQLDRAAAKYFLNLVHLSRAGSQVLRKILQTEIDADREAQERLKDQIQLPTFPRDKEATYFANWDLSAIHLLLRIESYRTERAISRRLNFPQDQVSRALKTLEELGLARKNAGRWEPLASDYHLSDDSPLRSTSHRNWRVRMADRIYLNEPQSLRYTGTHTLARKDFLKIRGILQRAITEVNATITPSKDEEFYCLLVDWDRV